MTDKDEFQDEINVVEASDDFGPYLSSETTEEKKQEKSTRPKWLKTKFNFDELTSRKDSGDIPRILKKLEIELPNNPLDYLLCTNMLSVGVDIQRLGLMIVNGQPKNHSEYIQATGRIGRKYPLNIIGLKLTPIAS